MKVHMNHRAKIGIVVIAAVVAALLFFSLRGPKQDPVVGSWRGEQKPGAGMDFRADGTLTVQLGNADGGLLQMNGVKFVGDWKRLDDDRIEATIEIFGGRVSSIHTVAIENDVMEATDEKGKTERWVRGEPLASSSNSERQSEETDVEQMTTAFEQIVAEIEARKKQPVRWIQATRSGSGSEYWKKSEDRLIDVTFEITPPKTRGIVTQSGQAEILVVVEHVKYISDDAKPTLFSTGELFSTELEAMAATKPDETEREKTKVSWTWEDDQWECSSFPLPDDWPFTAKHPEADIDLESIRAKELDIVAVKVWDEDSTAAAIEKLKAISDSEKKSADKPPIDPSDRKTLESDKTSEKPREEKVPYKPEASKPFEKVPDKTDFKVPAEKQLATAKSDAKPAAVKKSVETAKTTSDAKLRAIAAIKKLGGSIKLDVTRAGKPVSSVRLFDSKIRDPELVHLKEFSDLKVLYLGFSNSVGDAGLAHLSGLTKLESLDLAYTKVGDAGVKHVAGMVELRELDLFNTNVADVGFEHLKELTKLQTLNLSSTRITDAGMVNLTRMPNLQSLNLSETRMGDAGAMSLRNLNELREVDLSNTRLTDAGLLYLNGLTKLESLDLRGTKISSKGLKHLTPLKRLQSLKLSSIEINDTDLALMSGFADLKTLYLGWTKIGDAGLTHIADLKKLETLHLNNTIISDAGVAHLKKLTQLQSLHLDRNTITDAGLVHLKGFKQLKKLRLVGTEITDEGLVHLKGLSKLESLRMDHTRVTASGVKLLQDALPRCFVYRGEK